MELPPISKLPVIVPPVDLIPLPIMPLGDKLNTLLTLGLIFTDKESLRKVSPPFESIFKIETEFFVDRPNTSTVFIYYRNSFMISFEWLSVKLPLQAIT